MRPEAAQATDIGPGCSGLLVAPPMVLVVVVVLVDVASVGAVKVANRPRSEKGRTRRRHVRFNGSRAPKQTGSYREEFRTLACVRKSPKNEPAGMRL